MKTFRELQDLTGTWAVITGGAGYVGKAAAETIIELGGNVILLDNDMEKLKVAQTEIVSAKSSNTFLVCCDLSKDKQIEMAISEIAMITEGKVNILINNAAFVGTSDLEGWCVPFQEQSISTFRACLDVNLTAPFVISQKVCALMDNFQHPLKSIINISSIYGVVGPQMDLYAGTNMGNPAAYAASKAGLMQMTRWMAAVVSPKIRVNSIVLGGIERGQPTEFQQRYNSKVPLQRMATEEDLKGAIGYLSSQLSNYMTGQTLSVDGGWTIV
ncbi:SDR family oxidoreductase [Pseudoalteromonas xiamenensis]|uniref:SDR family oxidoreductase n=1 Tax=Pseudoalteromonas xiamenensis TaxID=882626 RepID=UPI0027E4D689|nr:SDR family oxidoreductase [Pseudoalteromonas xiamenensis]WMN59387.1 SDR family oxidoreductase [Pseudoalteromonas xiamenensis]